jgi:hypothetical protein
MKNQDSEINNQELMVTEMVRNETYQVDWNPRLAALWEPVIAAFMQPSGGVTPLGMTAAECAAGAALGQKLSPLIASGQPFSLTLEELVIFLFFLELLRRDLAAEFHQPLQGLQASMVEVVTAQTSKQMQQALEPLPKAAEKAVQRLRSLLKQRGALLDDVEKIRDTVMGYLAVS